MNIRVEPAALYLLLDEPVYLLEEKTSGLPAPQFLLNEVVFVLPDKEENLPLEEVLQFRKIFNWLALDDTAILTASEISEINWIQNEKIKKCLSFGVDLSTATANLLLKKYEAVDKAGTVFMLADDLKTLAANPERRRELSMLLKTVFQKK